MLVTIITISATVMLSIPIHHQIIWENGFGGKEGNIEKNRSSKIVPNYKGKTCHFPCLKTNTHIEFYITTALSCRLEWKTNRSIISQEIYTHKRHFDNRVIHLVLPWIFVQREFSFDEALLTSLRERLWRYSALLGTTCVRRWHVFVLGAVNVTNYSLDRIKT